MATAALKQKLPTVEEYTKPDGTKVVTMAGLTAEQINKMDHESEQMRQSEEEWKAKGSPWTEDNEALLNRMSS